jgi:hypothetical protein
MALKFVTKNGVKCHGPPYTKAEEAAFYGAWNRPTMTVLKDKSVAPTAKAAASKKNPRPAR